MAVLTATRFAGVGSTTRERWPFFGVVLPYLAMQEDDDVAQGVHVSAVSPRMYAINALAPSFKCWSRQGLTILQVQGESRTLGRGGLPRSVVL